MSDATNCVAIASVKATKRVNAPRPVPVANAEAVIILYFVPEKPFQCLRTPEPRKLSNQRHPLFPSYRSNLETLPLPDRPPLAALLPV